MLTRKLATAVITGLMLSGCSTSQPEILTAAELLATTNFAEGLVGAEYDGYFSDQIEFFAENQPTREPEIFTEINIAGHNKDNFSWQWTGYVRPDQNGSWTFSFSSDDAAYIWVGKEAISDFTAENALAKAPGIHGPLLAAGVMTLASDFYYPIRIQFGDKDNYEEFKLTLVRPDGSSVNNLVGLVFHNPSDVARDFGLNSQIASAAIDQAEANAELALRPATPQVATSTSGLSMDACEAPKTSPWEVGLGFPRAENLVSSTGEVKGVMIFVEFNDVKGDDDPLIVGRKFTQKFEEFYRINSYGKLNLSVDILPSYYKINKNSDVYKMDTWSSGDSGAYFADGIRAADKDVNYAQYDFVVVMPPAGIKKIIYGPAFPIVDASWWNLPTERRIYRGAVGGSDQRNQGDFTGWIWLAHEIGHVLGMEHQYNDFTKPAPVWDLMDNVYIDLAPSLFAWHRYQMGWFSERQVACYTKEQAEGSEIVLPLSPLDEQSNELKTIMIRLSKYKVLVAEARKESPIDKLSPQQQGLLVYVLDTQLSGKANPIRLADQQNPKNFNGQPLGTLSPGQSLVVEGFRVQYSGVDETGDWVRIVQE